MVTDPKPTQNISRLNEYLNFSLPVLSWHAKHSLTIVFMLNAQKIPLSLVHAFCRLFTSEEIVAVKNTTLHDVLAAVMYTENIQTNVFIWNKSG